MPRGRPKSVAAGESLSSSSGPKKAQRRADAASGQDEAAITSAPAPHSPKQQEEPSSALLPGLAPLEGTGTSVDDAARSVEQMPTSSSTAPDDTFAQGEVDELSLQVSKLIEDMLVRNGAKMEHLTTHTQQRPYIPQSLDGPGIQCYMGPLESQTLRTLHATTSETLARLNGDDSKSGAMLHAGGHVYSLDWLPTSHDPQLQHLCVSASLNNNPKTAIGGDLSAKSSTPATIQVWSVSEDWSARLDVVLCCDQGRISSVRWVPIAANSSASSRLGLDKTTLGVLSACMQDGSIAIYAVPHPESIGTTANNTARYIYLQPLLELDVKKGEPIVQEWYNANTLAVGHSDGWLSIWDLMHCLKVGTRRARPDTYSKVASSPISSLAWHPNGQQVYVAAYDGAARCVQLSQPHLNAMLYHSRDITYALAYNFTADTLLMERPELNDVRDIAFVEGKAASTTLHSHLGRVRAISTSTLHSLIASGGVDGSVRVINSREMMMTTSKGSRRHKDKVTIVYRLDRHRGTQDLRMIDNLAKVPTVYQTQHAMAATAAWDPSISSTALRWNPNQGKHDWLLSGLACGLVRVDEVIS